MNCTPCQQKRIASILYKLKALNAAEDFVIDKKTGKKGNWITVKGSKVFVEEGQTKEEAIKEKFGDSGGDKKPIDDLFVKKTKLFSKDGDERYVAAQPSAEAIYKEYKQEFDEYYRSHEDPSIYDAVDEIFGEEQAERMKEFGPRDHSMKHWLERYGQEGWEEIRKAQWAEEQEEKKKKEEAEKEKRKTTKGTLEYELENHPNVNDTNREGIERMVQGMQNYDISFSNGKLKGDTYNFYQENKDWVREHFAWDRNEKVWRVNPQYLGETEEKAINDIVGNTTDKDPSAKRVEKMSWDDWQTLADDNDWWDHKSWLKTKHDLWLAYRAHMRSYYTSRGKPIPEKWKKGTMAEASGSAVDFSKGASLTAREEFLDVTYVGEKFDRLS